MGTTKQHTSNFLILNLDKALDHPLEFLFDGADRFAVPLIGTHSPVRSFWSGTFVAWSSMHLLYGKEVVS